MASRCEPPDLRTESVMSLLYACCVVCYGMIAVAHVHECLKGGAGPKAHICTAAYVALTNGGSVGRISANAT